MKTKILLSTLLATSVILTACSNNSTNSTEKKEENKTEQTSSSTTNNSQTTTQENKKSDKEVAKQNKANFEQHKAEYDTGITFDQIAREPEEYLNKKVKYTGKVLQVLKGDLFNTMRLAVDGDYKKVVLVNYLSTASDKNILEDDNITILWYICWRD